MQTKNVLWFTAIILLHANVHTALETQANPYSYFDNEYTQWKIGQLFNNHKSLFQMKSQKDYLSFKQKNIVLEIPLTVNDNNRYKSRLGPRLIYYLTNKYKGTLVTESILQDPFYISSYKLDNNLSLYIQKGFSITFSLKPGIQKAEIVDIIPSHEDILPWLCTKETLIKKPACFEEKYETDNKNVSIVVNIKIFPKTVGKHNFRLYVLTKVNDSHYVIVTIPGHFSVSTNSKFYLFCYQSMFRISKSSKTYRYLWLKNEDRKMLEVTDVVSFGSNLKLSYPLEFELNEFKDQHIPIEAKKIIEDSEKRDFWLIPARSERPVLELIFNRHTYEDKIDIAELDWVLLQNNLIKIIIDKNEYLYGLTTFFSDNFKFWEHDFINLGILTSRHVYHEVDLYISNKTNFPVILNNIVLTWDNNDFDVYVASYYKHPIALPFYKNKFKIVKLLVKYKGTLEFSILRGKVKLQTNVFNQAYKESVSFYSLYSKHMLLLKKQKHFNIITEDQTSVDLHFIQKSGSSLNIERVSLNGIQNITRSYNVMPTKVRNFRCNEAMYLLTVTFEKENNTVARYKEEMLFVIHAFESIISKRIVFYYDTLICSPSNNPSVFRSCNQNNVVNFGYLREKRRRIVRKWIIKNPAPNNRTLTAFKFQNVSKLFVYKIIISKFTYKTKQRVFLQSLEFDSNQERKMSVTLKQSDRIHVELVISMSTRFKTLEKYVKHNTDLVFNMESGRSFSMKLEYGYIKGRIKANPKDILVDFVYPGPLPKYSIKAYSSYLVPIEIDDVKRLNDDHNIITISAFNNLINSKTRSLVVEFTIDPRLLLTNNENLISQITSDNNSICLHDIDRYHDGIVIWNKLKALNAYKINSEILLTTQLGTKIRIKINGSIRPPDFLPNPLFLGYNILNGINMHDLIIKNPYNKPIEVRLFLAPQQLLNIDKIDQEIIDQIKIHERSYSDNIICMANKNLTPDTLRFFIQNMYFENLEFLNHTNAAVSDNQICFKMPEKNAETNELYQKFASLSNFLFEFTHYKNKENFLKDNTIIINDIDRYTYEEPVVQVKTNWKTKSYAWLYRKLRFDIFTRKPKVVKVINKFNNSNFRLSHTKNITDYIQRKEVHLNQKHTNRAFIIKPKRTLTLKEAIILRPTANNYIQADKNIDLFLVIKNNITNIHTVPIKYLTVIAKLSGGSERIPNTGNKLVFNIDHIRYFDRESFYERKMQIRRLIKEDFYFENKGVNPVSIKNITIGNMDVKEPCLRLIEFRPKIIVPQTQTIIGAKKENSLKATFAFHVCRRFHSNTTVPIYLHSDEQVFEFEMIITFGKYVIKHVNSELSKKITSLFLAFFVIINTAAWVNLLLRACKRNKVVLLKPKRKADVFLTDERLKDRIIRYQAEIKLKMYENNPKPSDAKVSTTRKQSPNSKKGFKLMLKDNLLNQFDYNSNLYPFIKPSKFNDNSCISEETFEKLFPNASMNESSDNEMNQGNQRDQLFANSYLVEEEDANKNYGTIGDQSLSNLNIIANETFNSKDRKLRKKSDTISHEAFVNSIIIDHKLNKDPDYYEESSEDLDMYNDPEPISELNQLDYAFGTNLVPKTKKSTLADNRKRSLTDYTSHLKPGMLLGSPLNSERIVPNRPTKSKIANNPLRK